MDIFERAHVTKKSSSKMENKSGETVKKQLKQMMHAFRKGNNEEIRTSSEIKPKFDLEESTSSNDFSEFSVIKDSNNTVDTNSPSTISQNNSSYSNTSENTHGPTEDSLQDITSSSEEFKFRSTSSKDVYDTEKSGLFESSSEVQCSDRDSELSLPSSLLMSGSSVNLSDDEEFDADRTLASKILEKLGKTDNKGNKRKRAKDVIEIRKAVIDTKQKSKKGKSKEDKVKKNKNLNQEEEQSSKQKFEDTILKNSSDSSGQTFQDFFDNQVVTQSKKKTKPKQANPIIESSGDSMNESMDSVSDSISISSPFISVSAEDMSSQSLTDVLGDYVHPTIRNLPTDSQNVIPTRITSNMFPADTMFVNDFIDDEISSLIPEVDEELAIEDLVLDPGTQGLVKDGIHTEDTISDEDISETFNDEVASDTNELIADEPIKLYYGKDNYILVMKHPSQLYIHGKVQIGIINGVADIFGYKLNYDSIDVYAPYCYFPQCLKTLEDAKGPNLNLSSELSSVGLSADDTSEIVSNIQDNSVVIILSKLTNRRIDFVENNFSTTDLFSKRVDKSPLFLRRAAETLECSFYLIPPKKSFEEKDIWNEVYPSTRESSRGIVCGGKSTGKSTFLRHYVNSMVGLGPVLVIDLDPGQPEFTAPGVLSATIVHGPLLGPNFTHLKAPELMLNIGIINPMDNAKRYLSAARDIITYCRDNGNFRELPWIVNTMGLCNHMGLRFITYIILQLQPTFLLQIDSKTPKKRFEVELDPLTIVQMYHDSYSKERSFRSIRNPKVNYNFVISRHEGTKTPFGSFLQPRDERYLNILAYFGELLQDNRSRGLTELIPYEVNMKDLSIGLNVKIPDVPVEKVINGKIIALCQQNSYDKGQVFTLGDIALFCYGHGLIRGIDYDRGILYVLTPTPIGKLSLVDTLVYSDWMPELRGQELDLPSGTTVPYRTANAEIDQRMLMFPPRRRFNPVQLLKMTRNT